MLTDILPAKHRRVVYAAYAFLGVLLGAVQVGYTSADAGQPTWLTVTLAVYAFLGTAVGGVAAANTPQGRDEAGESALYAAVLVLAVLLVVLVLARLI